MFFGQFLNVWTLRESSPYNGGHISNRSCVNDLDGFDLAPLGGSDEGTKNDLALVRIRET